MLFKTINSICMPHLLTDDQLAGIACVNELAFKHLSIIVEQFIRTNENEGRRNTRDVGKYRGDLGSIRGGASNVRISKEFEALICKCNINVCFVTYAVARKSKVDPRRNSNYSGRQSEPKLAETKTKRIG